MGIPHPTAGEVPLAFIALQPGQSVSEKEICDYVAERVRNK